MKKNILAMSILLFAVSAFAHEKFAHENNRKFAIQKPSLIEFLMPGGPWIKANPYATKEEANNISYILTTSSVFRLLGIASSITALKHMVKTPINRTGIIVLSAIGTEICFDVLKERYFALGEIIDAINDRESSKIH